MFCYTGIATAINHAQFETSSVIVYSIGMILEAIGASTNNTIQDCCFDKKRIVLETV